MAALAATALNGVKVYNLSSGKTLPQWLADPRSQRALRKDEDYRRRVELLQDFHFPGSSQRVRMSMDGNFIVATGIYPPSVKVFDVRDLSLKFERRLDAEVVQLEILSPDFGKLAFLQADRSISFHAPYGSHDAVRIPKFGRDMCYHRERADLVVAASGTDVYRLNLDQGRFVAPLQLRPEAQAANVVGLNPVHQLLGVGCEDGVVECWDTRQATRVGELDAHGGSQVTALAFDDDGLTFATGSSDGIVKLFDLRSSRPLLSKTHQYGLPIVNVQFHDYARKVLSTDAKVIKIWDPRDGQALTNVETPADVNDVCVVESAQGQSGVLLVAGEQERVMSYYIPELGIAPKWCSFLDSLTEELEETAQATVYDDYKFVTRAELATLGLEHMVGTPLLKAYMHGFFMDARLYGKVKAVAEPFAYEDYRKQKLQDKLEAKHANRIAIQRRLPKVNRAVAERLLAQDAKKKTKTDESGEKQDGLLTDDRFSRMFTSRDFEVDEESDAYKRLHPNAPLAAARQRKEDVDSDGEDEEEEEEEDEVGGRFDRVVDDEDESEEDEEEVEDEDEDADEGSEDEPAAKHKTPAFYEIAAGEKVGDLMAFGSSRDRATQKNKRQLAKLPLAERVRLQRQDERERSAYKKEDATSGGASGGYMREMSFIPKGDKQRQQRNGGARDEGEAEDGGRRRKRGVGELKLASSGRNPRFRR